MNVKEMSTEMEGCFTSALVQDTEDMLEYNDVTPRVGDEYQAEIPYLPNCGGFGSLSDVSSNFSVGLPIPIMWVRKQSRNSIEETTNCLVTVTNNDETSSSKNGYVSSKDQDVKRQPEFLSLRDDDCKHAIRLSDSQDCNCSPLPGQKVEVWGVIEQSLFLLGLYIFGKNLILVKRFVGTKTMGDVLSYYYGPFYRSTDYRKWSEGRKSNNKRWIHGIKIFMGWRLKELMSRLSCHLSEERQKMLIEGSRMVGEDRITLEEYVITLKDWVGSDVLVDVIAIGKGKRDLTGTGMEPVKATHSVRVRADLAVGKDFSSLSSVEILEVLTGDSRLSKARSSDLFFEAVWPRLLARGWQSVQPRDTFSKLSVVYLPPGIQEFSQGLIRGDEYFDSISDILKKIASDPELLELEEEAVQSKKEPAKAMICSPKEQEDETLSEDQRLSYLKEPLLHHCDSMKFMVVDTSLASEGEQKKVRELRSLPVSRNNINESRYAPRVRHYSTNVTECVAKAASFAGQTYSGSNLARAELPGDSDQLVGIFGKHGELRNIISDEQSTVTGQPLNILAPPIHKQPTLIACSKRKSRHGIENISTEESPTEEQESSKELSSRSSASSHVEVPKINYDGISDENSYPRIVIDLNIPHASLNSSIKEEAITNDMQNDVHLSSDRKSHISDKRSDPNAPDISSFEGIENGRRQSTRNRPSAKALEAIAYGFLDTKKKRMKTMSHDNSNSRRQIQAKSTDQILAKSTDEPIVNNVVGNVA